MLSNKILFRGLMVQLVVGYIGSLLGGLVALIEGRLVSTQLLYWVMNIVGGAYVIYSIQKNGLNKSSKTISVVVFLVTVLGVLGTIFLWQQPIRYMSASSILAITSSVIITGVGITILFRSVFFREHGNEE